MQRRLSLLAFITVTAVAAGALAADPTPPKSTPELLQKGKTLFSTNCAPCHGETGDGNGPAAAALNPKPRNLATEPFKNGNKPEQAFKTLSEGLKGTTMPPFAHIAEADRWALVHYVLSMQKPAKPTKGKAAK